MDGHIRHRSILLHERRMCSCLIQGNLRREWRSSSGRWLQGIGHTWSRIALPHDCKGLTLYVNEQRSRSLLCLLLSSLIWQITQVVSQSFWFIRETYRRNLQWRFLRILHLQQDPSCFLLRFWLNYDITPHIILL